MSEQANATSAATAQAGQGQTTHASLAGGDNAASSTTAAAAAHGANVASAVQSTTITMTESATVAEPEILSLTLRPRPNVRWDEDVVNNEGMGRKSSKRCCIFHKQRKFGESSTDSDYDSDKSGSSETGGADRKGKIARPKKEQEVPDNQRFHA